MQPQGTEIFFASRKVAFSAGTLSTDHPDSRSSGLYFFFPLKTGCRQADVRFKTGFSVYSTQAHALLYVV